jgi:thiamine-phosphate pyrophosphorylase
VSLPRLHLVTDDGVLRRPGFGVLAGGLLADLGPAMALHLRGHRTAGGDMYRLAEPLARQAADAGALLLVNDRVDVALAVGCGAQVGRRSIPPARARKVLGPGAVIGYSAHGEAEALEAVADGADFLLLGTIWPSPSHPGGEAAGTGLVRAVAATTAAAVVAIGGVTPARVEEALEAGAHGVAVLSGVWDAPDPVAAAMAYLEATGAGG